MVCRVWNYRYEEAAGEARAGLLLFFSMASMWDKRLAFTAWVAYTRLLLLRANRLGHGMDSLPFDHDVPPNSAGNPLVPLQELVKQL